MPLIKKATTLKNQGVSFVKKGRLIGPGLLAPSLHPFAPTSIPHQIQKGYPSTFLHSSIPPCHPSPSPHSEPLSFMVPRTSASKNAPYGPPNTTRHRSRSCPPVYAAVTVCSPPFFPFPFTDTPRISTLLSRWQER